MTRRKAPKIKVAGVKKTKSKSHVSVSSSIGKKHAHDLRFGISLVLLTAVLEVSVMIFLLTLINHGGARHTAQAQAMSAVPAPQVTIAPSAKNQSQALADDNLDFTLSIPAGFGDWSYKIGYMKSAVNSDLADQYVKIYVPSVNWGKSNNFDERQKCILTIIKYNEEEYAELKKGCEKSNRFYCDMAGVELGGQEGHIWTHQKSETCPEKLEKQCGLRDQILKSFKLN